MPFAQSDALLQACGKITCVLGPAATERRHMYIIYEDDYHETAFPNWDSDGRIEVIWDHSDFQNVWSARWAPWPYDTPWSEHSLFDEKSIFNRWEPYAILLLHFRLNEVRKFLKPSELISSAPETILDFKTQIAGSTVRATVGTLTVLPSCFISYSSADVKFVRKLLSDLRKAGVRCWYAPDDLPIGEDMLGGLRQAIAMNDRVVLVLSAASVRSGWVRDEVTKVMAEERATRTNKLFPIMIDAVPLRSKVAWVAAIRESRNIGDFRSWHHSDKYDSQVKRLINDLERLAKQIPVHLVNAKTRETRRPT